MGFDIDTDDGKVKATGVPTPKKESHVRLIPPGVFFCTHCCAKYELALPVSISIMAAASKAFDKDHKSCTLDERGTGCTFCLGFGHGLWDCPKLQYGGELSKWWHGPDTGTSSKTLMVHLTQYVPYTYPTSAPRDPEDFGRCHRFLKAFPKYRSLIGEMCEVPGWGKLAAAWDELEALYDEEFPTGTCPKLYAKMAALQGESP